MESPFTYSLPYFFDTIFNMNATMEIRRSPRLNPPPRRSPRLNPPPRRSPRIKQQNERHADHADSPSVPIQPSTTSREQVNDNNGAVLSSRRSSQLRNNMRTPSPEAVVTPNCKRTPKAKTSSSKKSAVKFERNIRTVQRFNGSDPPSSVKRISGKRLFYAVEESRGDRTKIIKSNGTNVTQNMIFMCQTKELLVIVAVVVVIVTVIVGKFAVKW